MEYELKKKKNILIVGILSLLIILMGSTYAFFSYTKGSEAYVLSSSKISATFTSGTNSITFSNAYPISDQFAIQNLDKLTYIDFTVASEVVDETQAVEYEIYLTESDTNTLSSDYLKVYLTDENNKKIVSPTIYSSLNTSTYDSNGRVVYKDNNPGEHSKNYRLYVWLDQEYSQNDVSQTFTFKVNLYAYNAENQRLSYFLTNAIESHTTDTCNPIVEEDEIIYFSGTNDCVNFNYVWYSGKLWRITAIYPDGTMKMITDGMITSIAYGSKFYTDENTTSYMYQWLNQEFLPTLYNYENIIVEDAVWNASPGNETISSKLPVSGQEEVLVNASVGLLNSYEYYKSYQNTSSSNGYLNIGYYWWLLNPYSASSSSVWYVSNYGNGNNFGPSNTRGARPSIYLKSTIQLTGGSGTVDDPYRIKGDRENIEENVTLINTRGSGEYVKLVDEETAPTFRIVGTETINGAISTKLVLNDYVRDTTDVDADSNTTEVLTRAFSTTTSWSSVSEIDQTYWRGYLNNTWIKEVDPTYNSETGTFGMLERGTYYLGSVTESNRNYKLSVCKTVDNGKSVQDCIDENTDETSTVQTSVMEYSGLLRYGEMFASQFGTGSGNSSNMWLITSYRSYNSSYVWHVSKSGYGIYSRPSDTNGARPSINLKSTILIKSGSGTKTDPFLVGLPSSE